MQDKKTRPFGLRDKLGYLFGDFGNDFTFILSTMILTKFYTDVMGVSAGVVGLVMMVARFVDGFTDVAFGRICDRARSTAAGKFKPWLLRMCIPVAAASFLMYQSSLAGMSLRFKTVWLTATYILWGSVFYTCINIPYGSMASAISASPQDRQSLSTFRSMGATLAGMIVGIALPMLAYEKNAAGKEVLVGTRVTIAAGVFSALAIVCYLLCYFLVRERVRLAPSGGPAQKNSVISMLRNAARNRALLSIIAASVLMLLAQLTMQNMASYIFPEFYNSANAQAASTVAMLLAMLACAAVAKPLSTRFGKAELGAVSAFFAAVVCMGLFFLRPQSVGIYIALQSLCWLGLGMFTMVSWAMITDVIDYAQVKNGIREDGAVYALYSFARKLGQALAAGASGFLLDAIGYDPTRAQAGSAQGRQVLDGMFNISTLLPAIGFAALGFVLWLWYPLHKAEVEKNTNILQEKQKLKEDDE